VKNPKVTFTLDLFLSFCLANMLIRQADILKEQSNNLYKEEKTVNKLMSNKEIATKEGKVIETLMGGMFKVEFEDETIALAALSGKMRKFKIRILTGDKVKVEFSPHDLSRGRITYRYR
jgi:translation initiation factor IF-1